MINNCNLNKELHVNIAFYILQKYPNRDPKWGAFCKALELAEQPALPPPASARPRLQREPPSTAYGPSYFQPLLNSSSSPKAPLTVQAPTEMPAAGSSGSELGALRR